MNYFKIGIIIFLACFVYNSLAQNIVYAEYFIDEDPGLGEATALNFSSGETVNINFGISQSGLLAGFHNLYVRLKDDAGRWSIAYSKPFFKLESESPAAANLEAMEYFIDSDPGLGNGSSVSVGTGADIEGSFSVNTSGLDPGMRFLYTRVKNTDGVWSHPQPHPFYIIGSELQPAANINYMEYFIDLDPGLGNGTQVTIPSGNIAEGLFSVDISGLNPGVHFIYSRVRNTDNVWSISHASPFYIAAAPDSAADISYMEYFIDQDPGLGLGTAVTITTGQQVAGSFAINTDTLSPGLHILYTRSKDVAENWSMNQAHPFFKTADPAGEPANISRLIYFFFQNDSIFASQVVTNFESGRDVAISFAANTTGINLEDDYDIFIFAVDENGTRGVPFKLNDSLATDTVITAIDELIAMIPEKLYLKSNYPNPFNPSTTIQFGLPAAGNVRIVIYDMLGREVAEITNMQYAAGNYAVRWDGKNNSNEAVSSGMYVYKLISGQNVINRKMLLIR
jgi:hypothetical protein